MVNALSIIGSDKKWSYAVEYNSYFNWQRVLEKQPCQLCFKRDIRLLSTSLSKVNIVWYVHGGQESSSESSKKNLKRPWHASLFGHHTELTCSAELSQQRLRGLSRYYWQRYFSLEPQRPVAPVSCYATGAPEDQSSTPPTHTLNFHPTSSSSPPPSRWLHCVESRGYKKCSESEAWACWTDPSSGVQDYDLLRSSKRVVFFSSFLLHFLNNRCDDSVLACTCATPRCACISPHLSGGSASDKITLSVRTAGALIVFQRATCLR